MQLKNKNDFRNEAIFTQSENVGKFSNIHPVLVMNSEAGSLIYN